MSDQHVEIRTRGDKVTHMIVNGIDYFDCSMSSNARFAVGARPQAGLPGGSHVQGRVVLVDMQLQRICYEMAVVHPHGPSVSDEGRVLIEDWKSTTELSGAVFAFASDGARLWTHSFRANIGESCISSDGARAYVQTCNTHTAGAKLVLYDAESGNVLWSQKGEYRVRFQGARLVSSVENSDATVSVFEFDESGKLPGAYYDALRAADEARMRAIQEKSPFKKCSEAMGLLEGAYTDAGRGLTLLDEFESEHPDEARKHHSLVLRLRGHGARLKGENDRALELWERAMAIDPKIGLKREMAKLRKVLAAKLGRSPSG